VLVLLFATSPTIAANDRVVVSKVRLATSPASITAESYELAGAAPRATVLVLHGAGGTLLDGPEMRRVARALATDGNAVYLLHYFQPTGTMFALDATMQRNFRTWLEVVQSAVTAVQQERGSRAPVGIYGYSLGGFLALRAASDNPQVGAVVEHAGGVWNKRMDKIGRMPPVLMVHGERDKRVPFAQYAEPLVPVLRRRATKLETHFFPDEGHVFGRPAMETVRSDAARFFRRHLRRGE
jgi:dipeptidyl aminopeptidase/acylaminoacyl peptidase